MIFSYTLNSFSFVCGPNDLNVKIGRYEVVSKGKVAKSEVSAFTCINILFKYYFIWSSFLTLFSRQKMDWIMTIIAWNSYVVEEIILKTALAVPSTSKECLGQCWAVPIIELSHSVGVIDQVLMRKIILEPRWPPNPSKGSGEGAVVGEWETFSETACSTSVCAAESKCSLLFLFSLLNGKRNVTCFLVALWYV